MAGRTKQFLVLGLGSFGGSVATELCYMGHEVVAVDSNMERVEKMSETVTQAMQANVIDEMALKELGIRNYDAVIVGIGENLRASILVCVILKEMGAKYLIAKAMDDVHAKVLYKLGVDRVVYPERDTGIRIAKFLATDSIIDLMNLADGYQIMEIHLPEKWEDKTIFEMDVRKKFHINILAIRRADNYIVSPNPSTGFIKNDQILVLGKTDDISAIIDK